MRIYKKVLELCREKGIFKYVAAVICVTIVSICGNALGYTPPIGIPDPGFGIDSVKPPRPIPWTSSQPGYYYIDRYGNCTDTNNAYGYPGRGRCTVPDPITRGSYIEINGVYDHSSGGDIQFNGALDSRAPNGNNWSANNDGPAYITSYDSNAKISAAASIKILARGSYIIFDGINVENISLQIGTSSNISGYAADHIVVRNSTLIGDSSSRTSGIGILGNAVNANANLVIYKNRISNYGSMTVNTDQDQSAVFVAEYVSNAWILENIVHDIGNTAMFAGGQYGSVYTNTHNIYFGKNEIYNVRVGAIAVKNCKDVIVSQNHMHDIVDTSWSEAKCIGAQYSPQNFWVLFNRCHHARYGVKIASTDPGIWNHYFIGNLFYDIKSAYRCSDTGCQSGNYPSSGAYSEAGLGLWGCSNCYVVNNTIYDCSSGILSPSAFNFYIENNIIADISEPTGFHIWLSEPSESQYVRNNDISQYPGTLAIRWGGSTTYNTLSSFEAGTGKAQNNINANPIFINPRSYTNLNIQSGSPAKDSGLAAESLTNNVYATFNSLYGLNIQQDFLGTSRPQGPGWDMGAYERLRTTLPAPTNLRIVQ